MTRGTHQTMTLELGDTGFQDENSCFMWPKLGGGDKLAMN